MQAYDRKQAVASFVWLFQLAQLLKATNVNKSDCVYFVAGYLIADCD